MQLAVILSVAAAVASPSMWAESDTVKPGARYVLHGTGWSVSPDCDRRVDITRTLGHGIRIGRARLTADGSFTFSRRMPRAARRGDMIVLDATQYCDDGSGDRLGELTASVTLTAGRRGRRCGPHPLVVDQRAYLVTVHGGLSCAAGADAVGPFIDTGIDPDGFDCAHVDRRIAGHDYACVDTARPTRRVTARRVREV